MANLQWLVAAPAAGCLTALLVASGCSGPGEDVRVTLCKDILLTQEASAVIQGADTQTKGYEYAAVRVSFSHQGGDGEAVCYFNHDAVEDTAAHLSDPLSAYAASPFEVRIDGEALSRPGLAAAIKQALLKQGREMIHRASSGSGAADRR